MRLIEVVAVLLFAVLAISFIGWITGVWSLDWYAKFKSLSQSSKNNQEDRQ